MIAAIMQPYFFPYIGYFQLIRHCDVFVLYDDVQFIKGGWINRNRIISHGAPAMVTLPVRQGPHRALINQRRYRLDAENVCRILRRIEGAYRGAPYFAEAFQLVREIMAFEDSSVAAFNENVIRRVATHLGIGTRIIQSSSIAETQALKGEERVIRMCNALGATHYTNPIGGVDLYNAESFAARGIGLRFLESTPIPYDQGGPGFAPQLSIIDVMMFNDRRQFAALLDAFRLIDANAVQPRALAR